jgi:DNA-binding transcriptional MerR regulator
MAELAGTTVKTVRHYHQVGLLEEPERAANGYKHYRVSHLVRLLRIKRLVDLGVPLAQIATIGRVDEHPEEALRLIDSELASTVEHLQRVRAELGMIIRNSSPTDLPTGFGTVASSLTDADRALILIYSRIFDKSGMDDLRQMIQDSHDDPVRAEFDALPADADEPTRQRLAERYAPVTRSLTAKYPWLDDLGSKAPLGKAAAESLITDALVDLYNPAQLDVLNRSHLIIQSQRKGTP